MIAAAFERAGLLVDGAPSHFSPPILEELRKLDKVAYVRFASVYLDFKDVKEFMDELKDLLKTKESAPPAPPPRTKSGTARG